MSNSDNYKETKIFEIFKLIYFKKPTIKKVLIKLRVLSDASVLIKCWFNKQAPQKVLIELSPGVNYITFFTKYFKKDIYFKKSNSNMITVTRWLQPYPTPLP